MCCVPQDNEEAIEPDKKQGCASLSEIDKKYESFNRRFNIELDSDKARTKAAARVWRYLVQRGTKE